MRFGDHKFFRYSFIELWDQAMYGRVRVPEKPKTEIVKVKSGLWLGT